MDEPTVIALWRRCRAQVFNRLALPEAWAWRDGLAGVGDLANPAEAQTSLAQAQRVGYAVVGPGTSSIEMAYLRWCADQRLPLVVADLSGRYPWATGVVTSAEHARVRLSLLHCRWCFSDSELAAFQASCSVCIPPDDPHGGVSVTLGVVITIVPRVFAVPLAARLRDIAARQGVSEGWVQIGPIPSPPRRAGPEIRQVMILISPRIDGGSFMITLADKLLYQSGPMASRIQSAGPPSTALPPGGRRGPISCP